MVAALVTGAARSSFALEAPGVRRSAARAAWTAPSRSLPRALGLRRRETAVTPLRGQEPAASSGFSKYARPLEAAAGLPVVTTFVRMAANGDRDRGPGHRLRYLVVRAT